MKIANSASIAAMALLVTACATKPREIHAAYVSPMVYADKTCKQIIAEARAVSHRLSDLTQHQQREAHRDSAMMAVSLVLFWPAALFIKGDGPAASELARIKGHMRAIEDANTRKGCGLTYSQTRELRRTGVRPL